MRKTKTNIVTLEQHIISEEYAKTKLEQQLHLTKIREYKNATCNGKNGGLI